MKKNKNLLIIIIAVIVILVLLGLGYYFMTQNTAKPIVWDGAYKMSGNLPCKGNIPNLSTIPMDSTVNITSNKIIDEINGEVKSFDIDNKGKAIEIIESMAAGGVTTSGKADYQFAIEGGVYKFTAQGTITVSTTQGGKTYSSTCAGTITGTKQ